CRSGGSPRALNNDTLRWRSRDPARPPASSSSCRTVSTVTASRLVACRREFVGMSQAACSFSWLPGPPLAGHQWSKVLYCEASLLYFLAELNEFSNLGKGSGTMQVPYAKKWQKETDKLRQIALGCNLTEELKWGKPCFTFLKKNVAIVIPLKES